MLFKPEYDENGKKVLCEMNGINSEMLMDIYVKKLKKGETLEIIEENNECAILLLSGDVTFKVGNEIDERCKRKNPFEKKPYAVHFCKQVKASVTANEESEILVQMTDNEKTYEFIKKVGYTQLHVFPYSMRKGTPAARMVQVDEKIKHERVNRLIALSHELNENYAKSQIGKTLRVLFEKEDHGYYVGHGDNYLLIKVQSDEQLIGQLKNVIIDSYDEMLIGRVV